MNRLSTTPTALAALVASLGLTACAATTPHWDARFGEATKTLMAQQTRDPQATDLNEDRLVDGIEGRSARETMDRYYKSFSEPPRPYSVLTIGVGTAGQGAGGR